ncbi:MAG: NAD-dependent epimerase/dehydratase family protein [Patescibacteria group bacterium]
MLANVLKNDCENIVSNLGWTKLRLFKNKNILITGANGFIARSLAYFFAYLNEKYSQNIKMTLVVRGSVPGDSIAKFIKKQGGKFLRINLIKVFKLTPPIDYVFHLAAVTSPKLISENPVYSLKINIQGTANVLAAIKNKNVKKFLYFSSAAVYGSPDAASIPTSENYNGNVSPVSFRSSYAEGKRAAEALVVAYHRQFKIPVNIIRPANIYGPLMNFKQDNALNYFLNCVFRGKNPVLNTSGRSTRSFCYISDAISVILLACLCKNSGEVFNVGNEKAEIKIIDLAKLIGSVFDKKINVRVLGVNKIEFSKESIDRSVLSMKKVKKLLNFIPRINLEEGLGRLFRSRSE